MSYSACDFMDDVCEAAAQQLSAVMPEDDGSGDQASECADAVLDAISRAEARVRELTAALRDMVNAYDGLTDGQLAFNGQAERDMIAAAERARAVARVQS